MSVNFFLYVFQDAGVKVTLFLEAKQILLKAAYLWTDFKIKFHTNIRYNSIRDVSQDIWVKVKVTVAIHRKTFLWL